MYIDAIGKACPMPVMLAKKELDKGCADLVVAVDNKIAVENLSRLAEKRGLSVEVMEKESTFEVRIQVLEEDKIPLEQQSASVSQQAAEQQSTSEAQQPSEQQSASTMQVSPACGELGCGYAVFIGKDVVGDGERELGENLLKMAIYTLSQSDEVPASILFMNSGVKLPAGEEQQVIDSLKELMEKGTEVLVCGTCLNYYGLTDQLKIGTVSNMYDILGKMQSAAKVITL